MKIYMCCDIEGISGLTSFNEARSNDSSYGDMAVQLSKEVGAACRGAIKAGADEIVVEDCHGDGRNIIHEYLPDEVRLLRGITHDIFGVTGTFDSSFDGIMFIGYHDAAGRNGSPVAHTMVSSTIFEIKINGKNFSEFHHHAYAAANLGIPSIFISGDAGICKTAKKECPTINAVITKDGKGNGVLSSSPSKCLKMIEEESENAVKTLKEKKRIILAEDFKIEVTYIKHYNAYRNSHYPGANLISPNTISYESHDYSTIMRFLFFVI